MKGLQTYKIEIVDGLSDDEKDIIRDEISDACQKWIDDKISDFHFREYEDDLNDDEIQEMVKEEFKELGEIGWRDAEIIDFDKVDEPEKYQFVLLVINQFVDKL